MCSPGHKGHDDLTSSPPSSGLSPAVSSEFPSLHAGNRQQGLRSLRDLTQHFTARADDSHAAPVYSPQAADLSLNHSCICQALSSRIIELNHMLHRLCGPPSIPLSFTLAGILPRRCTYRVSFGTEVSPDTRCRSFTAWTTRVSNPVRYPRFRASASVLCQKPAFAIGVLPDIYRFHPYTRNSGSLSSTPASQFSAPSRS